MKGAEVVSRGADLFMEKGCYGCHDVKGVELPAQVRAAAHAAASRSSRTRRPGSYAWIKDPTHLSPDTAMPNFKLERRGGRQDHRLPADAARRASRTRAVALDGASPQEGERLFTERGCRGCHAREGRRAQRVAARAASGRHRLQGHAGMAGSLDRRSEGLQPRHRHAEGASSPTTSATRSSPTC